MEYKLLKFFRIDFKLPFLVRIFFCIIFIIIGLFPIILPLFPGSLFVGVFIFIMGLIMIIAPNKIKYLIKIRKSIIYMFLNLHRKKIVRQKIYDIKSHVLEILKADKKYMTKIGLKNI